MSPALHFERLLPCLLAALLVTAGVPASIASATDTGSDPEVTFTEAIYHEQRGDVAEITVALSGTDTATVRIAADETDVATVVVEDRDADGRATVLLNTYDGIVSVRNGDGVASRSAQNASAPLPVGVYDVLACSGETPDCERDVAEATRLTVAERSTDDLRAWVAPQSVDFANVSAVNAAKASGNLTQSSDVTKNDTLVLELRASGLDGAVTAQNGSNTTEQFFDLLEDDAAELGVRQINPGPEVRAAEIHLAEDSTRVVADSANDSHYVVVDLREANVTRGEREAEIRRRHEYEANFTVARSSSLTANGTESAATRFEIVEPTAELATAGERREFAEPAPNRTLYGSASLPPGSAVTVELASKDGDRHFSETVRVRNGSDGVGEFAATFDLSDVPEGTTFSVAVRAESYPGLDFDGSHVVVSEPTVKVGISSVEPTGVSIDANLSHGGFVVVRRGSVDGDPLGYTQYLDADGDENGYVSFDPDLESNATVFAVAYHDTDRDGEFDLEIDDPYTDGEYDHRVAVSKTVTVEEPEPTTATTRETTESSMRGETTTGVVTESVDPADPDPPGVGSPGFGVPAALAALLAVALLAHRR